MAARNPETAFRSKIYPPGAEYMLAEAESQAMAAVCGVLTESLTTTLSVSYLSRTVSASISDGLRLGILQASSSVQDFAYPLRSGE
jgi:hypothetical protein